MRVLLIPVFVIVLAPFLFFNAAEASVFITEIMYDPKDTDSNSGGEWIEVQNTGSVAIDLTKWIFFENDTNHGITADGISEIPPGGYAVISRDITVFKNYFSDFPGLLFKSSFSLNDGETLAIKSSKETPAVDSVTYTSEWGAKNDGNSLQKSGGSFTASAPTPGAAAVYYADAPAGEDAISEFSVPPPAQGVTSSWPVEPQVFANAGPDRVAIAGADIIFEGKAYGLKKEPLENARYAWNFGDGTAAEGKAVSHIYKYPGDYIVVLDVSSGYFSGSDRAGVKAEPSKISISSLGSVSRPGVEISNGSGSENDISSWTVRGATTTFTLPPRTFIAPGKKIYLSADTLGFTPHLSAQAELLYPNGFLAYRYEKGQTVAARPSVNAANSSVPKSDNSSASAVVNEANKLRAGVVASASDGTPDEEGGGISPWLMGAGAIALIGVLGALAVKFPPRTGVSAGDPKNAVSARDFKIIEEE